MSIKELRAFIEGQIDRPFDVENHLAELVKDDFFKVIITNNIDDILYESFKAVGMREKEHFVDCHLGRLSCADNIEHILSQKKINIRRLIRMAGDIDTFIGNLTRPQAKKDAGECVRSLLEKLRVREILIVGIDLAWDQMVLSALPSHLETIWFINEDEHIKEVFIENCKNTKNFCYITGSKSNYKHFFKHLYWNINQSITESHKLIEEVKGNMYNMWKDLNHIQKRNEEVNDHNTQNSKLIQSKLDSILHLLEDIYENRRLEGS